MSSTRIERAQQTRAALVAAGRRLFCEHPVDVVAIDDIVQAAVSYGLAFRCDPCAAFLDRPTGDLPVLLAMTHLANRAIDSANKRAKEG